MKFEYQFNDETGRWEVLLLKDINGKTKVIAQSCRPDERPEIIFGAIKAAFKAFEEAKE